MSVETLILEKHAYGGECFGRLDDGRAVFVPYAVPGERVKIRLVEQKKSFARGELLQVLDASPLRTAARCSHYQECGGCHYQHIPYEVQLEVKTSVLRDQLERIGGITNPFVRSIIPSPLAWNYRNQVQFHLTMDGKLGFQGRNSNQVIPIQECHLPEKILNDLWPRMDLEPIPGLDRFVLRCDSNNDVLLVMDSGRPEPVELRIDLPISVIHSGPGGSIVLAGDDHIVIHVSSLSFWVSAGSFFQVNTMAAEKMLEHILEFLSIPSGATLIDAYCGVGLFSKFLAPRVAHLIGIEASASACEDYVENLDEFDQVELFEAPVEDVLLTLDVIPDIVLVDPPRAGLHRRALDGILKLGPDTLVYVSCDPATLSRDGRRLIQGGYQLTHITPLDLFPQTFHIESISFWEPVR